MNHRVENQALPLSCDSVRLSLHQALPWELEVGRGQFLVVSGECAARDGRVNAVVIGFDGAREPAELSPALDGVSFWHAVFLPAGLAGRRVRLHIDVRTADGRTESVMAGEIACREVEWRPVANVPVRQGDGLVAICMATYKPDVAAFRRQVDSIRDQSYPSWLCIVNDDGTDDDAWQRMQAACDGDSRFVFHRNTANLGFYRNFESALKKVPPAAAYVAFSDQDDRWYPDKLSRLVEVLRREGASLAYSDMRIVDEGGAEVAGSYWVNRRNEYRDLQTVLVANTITGAASAFRRDLLPYLVPFPPRVGDAFHDHWLACVAMSTGRIAYVDAPLYDYYQYGSSVIGHCDFVRFTMVQRLASLGRLVGRLCRPAVARPLLRGKYASALAVYRGECRRLRLLQETIKRRCRIDASRARDLGLFDGGLRSLARLLKLHARVLATGRTTDDAELRLAMGEAARLVEKLRIRRGH